VCFLCTFLVNLAVLSINDGSSTHPPWQNLGPREGSAHGEPRAGTSCGLIPRRVVRALPWQGVSSPGAGNSFQRRVASFPVVWFGPSCGKGSRVLVRGTHFITSCHIRLRRSAFHLRRWEPPQRHPPPPPPSTSPATSVLRTGDSEPSPVHAVPEWENLKSSPSGGGLGGIDFGSLERNLSHICKQTSAAGRCVEVHTSRTQFPPSGPNPNSVPLRGAERNWSTLGGILDPLLRL
jgi:hypothetical protein